MRKHRVQLQVLVTIMCQSKKGGVELIYLKPLSINYHNLCLVVDELKSTQKTLALLLL